MLINLILMAMAGYVLYDTIVIAKKKEYRTWRYILLAQIIMVIAILYQLYLLGFLQVMSNPEQFLRRNLFENHVRIIFLIALAAGELLKMKRFKA